MPQQKLAFRSDELKHLKIVWKGRELEKDVQVFLGERLLGTIDTYRELAAGKAFILPDQAELVVKIYEGNLQIFRNGQALLTRQQAWRRLVGAIAITSLVLLAYLLWTRNRMDLSTFQTFKFQSGGGLGFCPAPSQLYSVKIERNDTNQYNLQLSTLEVGDSRIDTCLNQQLGVVGDSPCLIEVHAERNLSAQEIDAVHSAFASIAIVNWTESRCGLVEECLINNYRWDEIEVSDFVCSRPRILPNSGKNINKLLTTLRTSP